MSVDEYYGAMFAAVPGLADDAEAADQTPLEFMRDRGAYALNGDMYLPYERDVDPAALDGCHLDDAGVYRRSGTPGAWSGAPEDLAGLELAGLGDGSPAVQVDGTPKEGFPTPSRKLELYSQTLADWGWPEYATPTWIQSHVHWENLDLAGDERILLPTFRIPHAGPHPLGQQQVAVGDQPSPSAVDPPPPTPRPWASR